MKGSVKILVKRNNKEVSVSICAETYYEGVGEQPDLPSLLNRIGGHAYAVATQVPDQLNYTLIVNHTLENEQTQADIRISTENQAVAQGEEVGPVSYSATSS
jgi:hypothetical protein